MKYNRVGFTLVEMMVGVTLSLILMVSVSVFVSGGMQQLFSQKKMLDTQANEVLFIKNITEYINSLDSHRIFTFSGGMLFHTQQTLGNTPWILLHQKNIPFEYCKTGALSSQTSHALITQILPYEGEGADMSIFRSFDTQEIEIFPYENKILYQGIALTGAYLTPTAAFLTGSHLFVSDTFGNSIYKFDTNIPSNPAIKIIGESSFGETIDSFGNPLNSFLNGPTGLAWGESSLFIADTNNDRILRWNQSSNKIESILTSQDGLDEPTGILYDDTRKALFIVNSGKGEILEYTSFAESSIPDLDISFAPGRRVGVTQIKIEFLTTGSGILATPTFSGMTMTENYQTGGIDVFDYYISDFSQRESSLSNISLPGCSSKTQKYLEGNTPKKEITTCASSLTGTVEKFFGNNVLNFNDSITYGINLGNIVGNFSQNKSYAVKLSLLNRTGQTVWQNYFPFFTQGDKSIMTTSDNRLRVLKSGFQYPTGIYKLGENIMVYDFFARKKVEIDMVGQEVSKTDTAPFDFSSKQIHFSDRILSFPISLFQSQKTGDMVHMKINYFKNFACFDESKNLSKTFILKKYIGK